ncbi:MAG: Histidine triad (HIT) protein [Candidatus Magasanikbacteria bacterium GW2011_GWA2_46_17]|uniref:Histidine triad (HIT) protein n=1 Tax=Candidatus Magasanikbacteria bacterium GW2011_GWA2_46_17 TaxID=1619042 RepID=A0A0G1P1C7_9BACT|nr:MAG: Histidine triad (HIT) protein [Candidatus Magasanikbacteria bacterium GW2011_GWA2_46_17]
MCIFCKIINKEIPNYTVYEDEYCLAFLDIHPCAKGHTVVIPKTHAEMLYEMSEMDYVRLADGLRHAMNRVREALQPDGMNVGINIGHVAGQAVGHVHWHIIPRWEGDDGGSMHSIVRNPGDESAEEVAKKFTIIL